MLLVNTGSLLIGSFLDGDQGFFSFELDRGGLITQRTQRNTQRTQRVVGGFLFWLWVYGTLKCRLGLQKYGAFRASLAVF